MTDVLDYGAVETITTTERDWTGTHSELVDAISNEIEIIGFEGGVKIPQSRGEELVPEGLSLSTKPTMEDKLIPVEFIDEETGETGITKETIQVQTVNEDGEPQYEQKTWREFAITSEAVDGELLLGTFHYINESHCHSVITSEELYIWAEALGKTNFVTKSEFALMRKVSEEEENML